MLEETSDPSPVLDPDALAGPSAEPRADRPDEAVPNSGDLTVLRALDLGQMQELVAEGGFPAYRAKQLYGWVFGKGVESLDEMKNLPRSMRDWLGARSRIAPLEMIEAKGEENATRKIAWRLDDGSVIESVLMRDEGKGRTGLCISSQVGCAVGCTFCLTGFGGFVRHCTVAEIIGQVLGVRRHLLALGERIHSFVFMGMGEPMLNLGAVIASIRLMTDTEGMAISPRRITVSTAGVVQGIEEFGRAATGVNLAVSLNATTDDVRTSIMPLNSRWPIARLLKACRDFPMATRRRITVEYVLMRGINDSEQDARRLVRLLAPLRCKVNLIMFNPHEELDFQPVEESTLDLFMKILSGAHLTASVRWSKGREIEAACGQLAAHHFGAASA